MEDNWKKIAGTKEHLVHAREIVKHVMDHKVATFEEARSLVETIAVADLHWSNEGMQIALSRLFAYYGMRDQSPVFDDQLIKQAAEVSEGSAEFHILCDKLQDLQDEVLIVSSMLEKLVNGDSHGDSK